ncbi:MAG: transposase [Betaproteobacteria bacterium]|nr:transposase [Betaproteobacteria bacterium]
MSYAALRKGRFSEAQRAYFITCVLADRRSALFADLFLVRQVVAEMRRLHEAGLVNSLAWVVMPDHIHWLLQLENQIELAGIMKSFKARSALAINRRLGRHGPLWQKAYHDHALRDGEDPYATARYIAANPLRAGLVQDIGDYPHWDAAWL